ncbi:MAG: DUF2071 domain-containing protein [Ferruginibacter sp.]
MQKVFLSAEWRNLIMANYIIEPALLQPYLPAGTELDFYHGNTYVSLVGFMFAHTKIRGIKIPFHANFEEVNLRFYVRRFENGTWKRGVVFIKEIVPKPAISFVANTVYKEKYCRMPMKHFLSVSNGQMQTGYQWKNRDRWHSLEATAVATARDIVPGSEEEFIAEHYFGYSRYDAATTYEYEVKHPRWQVYLLYNYKVSCDFKNIYGGSFAFLQNIQPNTVFMAKGSAVTVSFKKLV